MYTEKVASFPGPSQLSVTCSRKSSRGPEIIHYVSDIVNDIAGREKVKLSVGELLMCPCT